MISLLKKSLKPDIGNEQKVKAENNYSCLARYSRWFKGVADKKNVAWKYQQSHCRSQPMQKAPPFVIYLEKVAEDRSNRKGEQNKKQAYPDKFRIVFFPKGIWGEIFRSLDQHRMD